MLKVLFEASAIGEVAVGVAVATLPRTVMGLLFAAPIDGVAAVIARMFGLAIAALGLTWWLAVSDLDEQARMAPGWFVYNLGVGALLLSYALAAGGAIIPGVAGGVHLLIGFTVCALFIVQRHTSHA